MTTNVDVGHLIDPSSYRTVADGVDLMVLDVHGVVFNAPLTAFIAELGVRSGAGAGVFGELWTQRLREPFWAGRLTELELWAALAPGHDPHVLRVDLEARYAPGPLLAPVLAHPGPVWLLSNHRSDWLHDRLDRFGIHDRFERIIVSDAIGAAKPSHRAFAMVTDAIGARRACFVDDQERNVVASRSFGLPARLVRQGRV